MVGILDSWRRFVYLCVAFFAWVGVADSSKLSESCLNMSQEVFFCLVCALSLKVKLLKVSSYVFVIKLFVLSARGDRYFYFIINLQAFRCKKLKCSSGTFLWK
jgi:hypothetical protein